MSFLKANKKKKDALKFFNAAKNGTVNDIKLFIEKGKLDLVNKLVSLYLFIHHTQNLYNFKT